MKSFLFLTSLFLLFNSQAQVGIGTTTPTEKLHVDSGNVKIGASIWSTETNNRFLKFGDGAFVQIGEAVSDDVMELAAKYFVFKNSNGYGPTWGRVGINTSGDPLATLDVNGTVRFTDGTQGTNKVLTSDASGLATWKAPANANSGLSVAVNANQSIFSGGGSARVDFGYENYDHANQFNNAAGFSSFTAATTGVYHVEVNLNWSLVATAAPYTITVQLGSFIPSFVSFSIVPANSALPFTSSLSKDIYLTAGDSFAVYVSQNSGLTQTLSSQYSQLTIHKVY